MDVPIYNNESLMTQIDLINKSQNFVLCI